MKKLITLSSISLLFVAAATAAPLSPENALERALENRGAVTGFTQGSRVSLPQPELKKTYKARDGKALLYVFDNATNDGFMIVSADDEALPLLGYSNEGTFDPANMPPALEYWLGEYSRQIEYAREAGLTRSQEELPAERVTLPESWTPVAPILHTTWNQDAPYNNLCPKVGNVSTYTGCVATSVAQIMKHFNYPAKGQGQIEYFASQIREYLDMDFSQVTFDWNNMLNSYLGNYSETNAMAVATLMQAVGYALKMDYGTVQSGALSGNLPNAIVDYFDYDPGVRYYTREMFTYTDWAQMIYNNLKNVGPVVYDGGGSVGGHSWVCDGYDGQGLFHMNWGWGGMSDGYYALDALSPSALGIGAGAGNFNYGQGGLFNMQPNKNNGGTPQHEMLIYGSLTGEVLGNSLMLLPKGGTNPGWGYQGLGSFEAMIGLGYAPAGSSQDYQYLPESTMTYYKFVGGTYIQSEYGFKVSLTNMNMEDGVKYKVVAAYRDRQTQWHEFPVEVGGFNYFYLTKNGNVYTIDNLTPLQFEGLDVTFNSPLYYNSAVELSTSLQNNNDTELTRSVALALKNSSGKLAFLGDPVLVTLAPGESVTKTWATNLSRQAGVSAVTSPTEFYPALYDTENLVEFYVSPNTVTMQKAAGTLKTESSTQVLGVPTFNTSQEGTYWYEIPNGADFDVEATVRVIQGYLSQKLYVGIYNYAGVQNGQNVYTLTTAYPLGEDLIFLNEGETKSWTLNIDFPYGGGEQQNLMGVLDSSRKPLNTLDAVLDIQGYMSAGVESITVSEGEILFLMDNATSTLTVTGGESGIASVDVYHINGMKAPAKVSYQNGNAYCDLSEVGKGIVAVTAIDRSGNRKAMKTVLR